MIKRGIQLFSRNVSAVAERTVGKKFFDAVSCKNRALPSEQDIRVHDVSSFSQFNESAAENELNVMKTRRVSTLQIDPSGLFPDGLKSYRLDFKFFCPVKNQEDLLRALGEKRITGVSLICESSNDIKLAQSISFLAERYGLQVRALIRREMRPEDVEETVSWIARLATSGVHCIIIDPIVTESSCKSISETREVLRETIKRASEISLQCGDPMFNRLGLIAHRSFGTIALELKVIHLLVSSTDPNFFSAEELSRHMSDVWTSEDMEMSDIE